MATYHLIVACWLVFSIGVAVGAFAAMFFIRENRPERDTSAGSDGAIAAPCNQIVLRHLASGGARTLSLNNGSGGGGSNVTVFGKTGGGPRAA